jgi:glycogen(starch) synthase
MSIHTSSPSFSVIVNTIDRAGPLQTLLRALDQQSYSNFEVVVVVGPTQDNTLDMLSHYENRIRILHCPTANLSHSRNLGLLAANGDIIAYIDDDAVPSRRWLEQYARIFQNPAIEASGGAVWAAHPQFSMLQFRLGLSSSLSEQVDVRSSWADQLPPKGFSKRWVPRAMGANMLCRRQTLLEARGFDEFYQFIAEEPDLFLRLANAGKGIHPVKEAVVYHFPASSRNRQAFTHRGKWWLRTKSRLYLGIKHGLISGESLKAIIQRSIRTAGANFPMYMILVRDRQLSPLEFVSIAGKELYAGMDALFQSLLKPRQLIPPAAAENAQKTSGPILKFQNPQSVNQPSVDPVSGNSSYISMPEPPLRICLLSGEYPPSAYGGVARLSNLMAKGLFELGHTVHVITRGDKAKVTFYDGAYVHSIPNVLERYQAYQRFAHLYHTLNYSHNVYDKVKQLILNDGIQVVASQLWQYEGLVTSISGNIPVVAHLNTGLRQITKIHKSRLDEFSLMGDLEESFLELARYLVPNSRATLEAIQNVYNLNSFERRCTVIPHGIEPAPDDQIRPFEPDSTHRTLRVLYVGRMEKRKGTVDLFEAIPLVIRKFPEVEFVIAGGDNSTSDGFKLQTGMDYPTYFANHYAKYLPQVNFTGLVSDEELNGLYQSCDLFVAPSLYESFGLVFLEAMNYAKPVVSCRAGGIPEVVEHDITGILVEPHAPKALAEAILSLLNSPKKLREMGLAGRSRLTANFSHLEMARRFARIYRQVISDFEAVGTSGFQGW